MLDKAKMVPISNSKDLKVRYNYLNGLYCRLSGSIKPVKGSKLDRNPAFLTSRFVCTKSSAKNELETNLTFDVRIKNDAVTTVDQIRLNKVGQTLRVLFLFICGYVNLELCYYNG